MDTPTLPSCPRWSRGWFVGMLAGLLSGCHEAPPATAPPTPPAPNVPLAETFQLSVIQFQYDERRRNLQVSYDIHNRGLIRERSFLCADLMDQDGFFIRQDMIMGRISLAGGKDTRAQGESFIDPVTWRDTRQLRVFVASPVCSRDVKNQRSEMLFLDKAGRPLSPRERTEGKPSAGPATASGPVFRLEDVRVTQNDQDELWVSYQATNLSKGRASARLCVLLRDDAKCPCRNLDLAEEFPGFELGLGGSGRQSSPLRVRHRSRWDKGRELTFYLSRFGCASPLEQATSNVITVLKPSAIHAPREEAKTP